jgi:hypothetical protein
MSSQAIENFQSPFDSGGVLDGDKKSLIAPLMVIMATKLFLVIIEDLLVTSFFESPCRELSKNM